MPSPTLLIPPILTLLSTDAQFSEYGNVDFVLFAATYNTIYGKTGMSNIITMGPVTSWTSATLEVKDENIPDYATGVVFYRYFSNTSGGGAYRVVLEVKIK